jgi:FkbM family methyltransferase
MVFMLKSIKHVLKGFFRVIGLNVAYMHDYEKHKFVWLEEYNINTVIDVGANVGQFALEISKFLPKAFVYSFEPQKHEYSTLIQNCNQLKNFRAFNLGLGDSEGSSAIHKCSYTPGSSMLQMTSLTRGVFQNLKDVTHTSEDITIAKLDDMVANKQVVIGENILIKVDVQGFEDKVISGGINTFQKAKIVIIEVCFYELYTGQPLFSGIYSILTRIGFTYKGDINICFHEKNGKPIFSDALFIRE